MSIGDVLFELGALFCFFCLLKSHLSCSVKMALLHLIESSSLLYLA